jgi:hypothetical protein
LLSLLCFWNRKKDLHSGDVIFQTSRFFLKDLDRVIETLRFERKVFYTKRAKEYILKTLTGSNYPRITLGTISFDLSEKMLSLEEILSQTKVWHEVELAAHPNSESRKALETRLTLLIKKTKNTTSSSPILDLLNKI